MSGSSSKKIFLFGKTGDGKSTVANMLSTGNPDGKCAIDNSLAPVTKGMQHVFNEDMNWVIIDTEGLLAPGRQQVDVSHVKEVCKYFKEQGFDLEVHKFCYIKRATKFTRADEQCWKAFNNLVLGVPKKNIVLIFTSCRRGQSWLEENNDLITEKMGPGRFKRTAVDFPPHSDDPQMENDLKGKRAEYLETLKKELASEAPPCSLMPPSKGLTTTLPQWGPLGCTKPSIKDVEHQIMP